MLVVLERDDFSFFSDRVGFVILRCGFDYTYTNIIVRFIRRVNVNLNLVVLEQLVIFGDI